MKLLKSYNLGLVLASMALLIASCGGSGSGAPAAAAAAASTTITGSVFAAPVAGATVIVLDSTGTIIAGPVETLNDGTYSVSLPTAELANDLVFSSSFGVFTDEATGALTPAGTMSAYVEAGRLSAAAKITLDPASTIIHELVSTRGKTLSQAKTIFFNAFGYTPDISVTPVLPNTPVTESTKPQRFAGLFAAAISQITKDLSLSPDKQFDLCTALADDIADGKLDGLVDATTPVPIGGTGTNVPADVITKIGKALENCSKVAYTPSYKIVYSYPMGSMGSSQGKSTFKLAITGPSGITPMPGLVLSVEPMMHMSSAEHAAPVDTIVDNGDGTYTCTIYYLMASVMNGMASGHWELTVTIGSGTSAETSYFYPFAGMAMGDTASASLYGPSDIVSGMSGTENRKYYLFKENVISAATPTLNLYIAHDEGMKMSFKPAFNGAVLSGTTTSLSVRASTDKSTWSTSNVDNANGHWSLSGISGLVSGVTTTIYVELIANAEQKTTNGSGPAGTNDYASFKVTPQP